MRRICLTTSAILLAATAMAQEPLLDSELLAEEVPEIRHYTVELIVFRYAENVSIGTEIFQPDIIEPVEPEPLLEDELAIAEEPEPEPEPEPDELDELAAEEEILFEMNLLAEDELTLIETRRRLDRLDAYEPLLHIGWTQTALPEEETPVLDLREFGEPPPGLNGSFTLFLSRFLHLVVDLELDAPEAEQTFGDAVPRFEEPVRRYADESGSSQFDVGYVYDAPVYAPLRYRIDEDRLFKSGEIRYFDHPKFGVIAKILRYEEPEAEEFPDDTEFLSPAVVGD